MNSLDEGVGLGQQRAPVQVWDVDGLRHIDEQQAPRRRALPRSARLQNTDGGMSQRYVQAQRCVQAVDDDEQQAPLWRILARRA